MWRSAWAPRAQDAELSNPDFTLWAMGAKEGVRGGVELHCVLGSDAFGEWVGRERDRVPGGVAVACGTSRCLRRPAGARTLDTGH